MSLLLSDITRRSVLPQRACPVQSRLTVSSIILGTHALTVEYTYQICAPDSRVPHTVTAAPHDSRFTLAVLRRILGGNSMGSSASVFWNAQGAKLTLLPMSI